MARLALSDADREARDWFVATTESLGCITTVDSMVRVKCISTAFITSCPLWSMQGNIFAVKEGKDKGPPTVVGSHLDTQYGYQSQIWR